jgi:hypothetical protein
LSTSPVGVTRPQRFPATTPAVFPRNKGQSYPADPSTVEEIVAVMRQAPDNRHGHRVRAMVVVLCGAEPYGQTGHHRAVRLYVLHSFAGGQQRVSCR